MKTMKTNAGRATALFLVGASVACGGAKGSGSGGGRAPTGGGPISSNVCEQSWSMVVDYAKSFSYQRHHTSYVNAAGQPDAARAWDDILESEVPNPSQIKLTSTTKRADSPDATFAMVMEHDDYVKTCANLETSDTESTTNPDVPTYVVVTERDEAVTVPAGTFQAHYKKEQYGDDPKDLLETWTAAGAAMTDLKRVVTDANGTETSELVEQH